MTVRLGLEGMPRRLFACMPSRRTTWLNCPRRYPLTHLDRPAPPRGGAWAHSTVGATVHLAVDEPGPCCGWCDHARSCAADERAAPEVA